MADDPPKPRRLRTEVPAFCEAATCRQASAPRGVGGYGSWGPRACPWGSIVLGREGVIRFGKSKPTEEKSDG